MRYTLDSKSEIQNTPWESEKTLKAIVLVGFKSRIKRSTMKSEKGNIFELVKVGIIEPLNLEGT
jgi:hypothetical protein